MGDDPTPFPPLEPSKWYCVTYETYVFEGDPEGCTGAKIADAKCCNTGLDLTLWFLAGYQCRWQFHNCFPGDLRSAGIISMTGPYDDFVTCDGDC